VSVTLDDVRHIAALSRLALPDDRAQSIVVELNTILEHMSVLAKVDTTGIDPVAGIGVAGLPLRADTGPPVPLARDREAFAPSMGDGFFLVPRLSTHEDAEAAS
jgi:aspartyl-tRNA(Asn)/glutamyl-tRNA(Gln) amidotransferase subunit C